MVHPPHTNAQSGGLETSQDLAVKRSNAQLVYVSSYDNHVDPGYPHSPPQPPPP